MGRFVRLPPGIRFQPVSANGVAAEWITEADAERGAILYLHGGVYTLGSINTHREFGARLARAAGVPGLLLGYRLAPEHPFPAAIEDTLTAYSWLLDRGIAPKQIVFAGDSAGGGLAVAALVALRDADEALPAGAVCISPWTDLTLSGASIRGKAKADPILDGAALGKYVNYYAGDHDPATSLLSPVYADLEGLPPLLIQTGTEEILLDDARRIAERARAAGVPVTLEVWDEMVHAFQLIPFLPESKQAVSQIASFLSDTLSSNANLGVD